MSYKDDFKTRNKYRVGEEKAEEHYKSIDGIFMRYGFDLLDSGIKPYDFAKMPNFIKNTPDYAMIYKGHTFYDLQLLLPILVLRLLFLLMSSHKAVFQILLWFFLQT